MSRQVRPVQPVSDQGSGVRFLVAALRASRDKARPLGELVGSKLAGSAVCWPVLLRGGELPAARYVACARAVLVTLLWRLDSRRPAKAGWSQVSGSPGVCGGRCRRALRRTSAPFCRL